MKRHVGLIVGMFGLVLLTVAAGCDAKPRNPFDVPDVENPDGDDVKEFAKGVTLAGDDKDKNAEQWVETETAGKADSLEGEWSGRWENGSGTATIKVTKDRVFVLYKEATTTWLLEAVKEGKDRLIGRWVQVGNTNDTGPFVGLIVNGERIDGSWAEGQRWDFRRKLKK